MRDSGIYYLQIRGTTYWYLKVYCEQDVADGGWIVIQRRDDLGEPRENFNRDWNDYKNGFGDPSKEFWLGNENIYMLTNNEEYTLRVELEDFEGNKRYAQYSHFKIYSEAEYYKLEIDGYEGNAGDSLNDPWISQPDKVIQRRDDLGEPRENFNRDWNDYKNGFGDPSKEFWLGNENIYMLTNNEEYTLRVELEDFEGNKRYAQYSHFKIYSEAEYYKLEIDGYEGNAGDSLNDPWDNDRSSLNCASMLKGGWWWKSCGRGLNGLYLNDPQDLTARQGKL
ncbi:hypothetical protein J437_LFUL002817 [Ladona fulva]|uniref:Fibrinogen C-terminal domain-containing protein n=1 Tax=Ladona fulva TaxID=123851 RepID=A0A8K0JSC1_LADFU|nr:hypothetical protein J437_LFUL002817 [Ladona fulva]